MRPIRTICLTVLACLALAPAAFAHKGLENHTHCSVKDVGIRAEGKTDAQRKASCGKVAGAVWDDTKVVSIESGSPASTAPVDAPPH